MSRPLLPDEFRQQLSNLRWDADYWYSYVTQGLANEISGHTRKDQRYYQRKFCSFYSRLKRFREQHAEFLI